MAGTINWPLDTTTLSNAEFVVDVVDSVIFEVKDVSPDLLDDCVTTCEQGFIDCASLLLPLEKNVTDYGAICHIPMVQVENIHSSVDLDSTCIQTCASHVAALGHDETVSDEHDTDTSIVPRLDFIGSIGKHGVYRF